MFSNRIFMSSNQEGFNTSLWLDTDAYLSTVCVSIRQFIACASGTTSEWHFIWYSYWLLESRNDITQVFWPGAHVNQCESLCRTQRKPISRSKNDGYSERARQSVNASRLSLRLKKNVCRGSMSRVLNELEDGNYYYLFPPNNYQKWNQTH